MEAEALVTVAAAAVTVVAMAMPRAAAKLGFLDIKALQAGRVVVVAAAPSTAAAAAARTPAGA
jgi:NADPH-dependent curcumin reductase CurA